MYPVWFVTSVPGLYPFLRYAFLLRLEDRGRPSVACPFAGPRVHWTLGKSPAHPWRARSAGQSLRLRTPCFAWAPAQAIRGLGVRRDNPFGCALPASLGHRPKPSVARAFAGTTVHRTVVFLRLTHRTLA